MDKYNQIILDRYSTDQSLGMPFIDEAILRKNCLSKVLDLKELEGQILLIQSGDFPDTYADNDDFVKDFGYKPSTSVKDGIKVFSNCYLDFYGRK